MIWFWAQSLDNKSPDMFATDRPTNLVPKEDEHTRSRIVTRISNASRGVLIGPVAGVVAHLAGSEFVIKAPCEERDVAGRLAPVVAVGSIPTGPSEGFADDTTREFREFAATINRRLLPATLRAIENLAQDLLKKKRRTRRLLVSVGCVVVLAILLLGWWTM